MPVTSLECGLDDGKVSTFIAALSLAVRYGDSLRYRALSLVLAFSVSHSLSVDCCCGGDDVERSRKRFHTVGKFMSLERVQHLLSMAEAEVAKCEAQIDKRRALLAQIESADAHGVQAVRDTVHQWEELQKLHLADQDRLRRELAALQGHPLVPRQVSETDVVWAAKVEEVIQEILQTAEGGDELGEKAPSIVSGG